MRCLMNASRLANRLRPLPVCSKRLFADAPDFDQLESSTIRPGLLEDKIVHKLEVVRKFDPAPYVDMKKMFDAGVWQGHKIGTLKPDMKWALYGQRMGTCVFDLEITQRYMHRALLFLAAAAYKGAIVLFITTNRDSMQLVERMANEVGEYAHTRKWEASTLTNIKQLFDAPLRLPDVVIFLTTLSATMTPHPAIVEAAKMAIPTIGVIDTNCEPTFITYPIPGSDDSVRTTEFYMKAFCGAIEFGKEARKREEEKNKDEPQNAATSN